MTYGLPEDPQPELSTTRVASGWAARWMAVLVAGLLIGLVGFTVLNRPPHATAPSPASPAIAAAATESPTAAPTPAPAPTPMRNQLEGNDGIFGWPVVVQLAYLWADPLANYDGPRGPGLFNRCRWGDGPQGAPPRRDHDEAGCLDS